MDSKRARVSTTTENFDRINSLPDGVICHILSFLHTDESVRTIVLSTRWKHLFSFVPVLNFYYPFRYGPDRTISFLNFVEWVFDSYNVNHMDTFRFISSEYPNRASSLPSWISKSVSHGVQKIEIDVFLHAPQRLPRCVFTSKTLTYLSLKGHFCLEVPEDVCLPHLRTLSLVELSLIDGASFQRLFRSCPLLEKLFIVFYTTRGIQNLDISVPSLKILKIMHGYRDKFDLVLDVPNVEDFSYTSGGLGHESYTVKDLNLLSKAYICIHSNDRCKSFVKFVGEICHVRHLSFHGFMLKDFQESGRSLPIFCNLTYLEIIQITCYRSQLILDLLDRTPHLQVLVVSIAFFPEGDDENGQSAHFWPEHVPACVSLHLKKLEFKEFSMMKSEFKMVEYFLKNAKNLDVLKIRLSRSVDSSLEKQIETRNKLMSFSRCSVACEIVVLEAIFFPILFV